MLNRNSIITDGCRNVRAGIGNGSSCGESADADPFVPDLEREGILAPWSCVRYRVSQGIGDHTALRKCEGRWSLSGEADMNALIARSKMLADMGPVRSEFGE